MGIYDYNLRSIDQLVWREWGSFRAEGVQQLLLDSRWTIGSAIFIKLFVFLQTRSIVLTIGGVLGIWLAFPFTYFLYRVILSMRWVGVLHFIGVFVILGIGCDDIFVVFEHWQQAKSEAAFTPQYGMLITCNRASCV